MKTLFALAIMALALAIPASAVTCSTTSPCVAVTNTNSSMAATVTTNSAGIETSGPGTVTFYRCEGAATSCTAAALTAFIASPSTASVWSIVATGTQTASTRVDNDPEPYGVLLNYATQNSWTGGGTGPVSAIVTFQMGTAPTSAPLAGTVTVVLATGGTSGLQ